MNFIPTILETALRVLSKQVIYLFKLIENFHGLMIIFLNFLIP